MERSSKMAGDMASAAAIADAEAARRAVLTDRRADDPALTPMLLPRLFIVCGRERKIEELRALFEQCGRIRHLHLATDRAHKSRGFAFLQYDEQACAEKAIERFDHMTLSDGHVLKVTVAREKASNASGAALGSRHPPGKLKRNQHTQEVEDCAAGQPLDGDRLDARLPGKRQRSSPPARTATAGVGASANTSSATNAPVLKAWRQVLQSKSSQPVAIVPLQSQDTANDEVKAVLSGIVEEVVRRCNERDDVAMESDITHKPFKRKVGMRELPASEEISADLLTTCIKSVRLDSEPVRSRRRHRHDPASPASQLQTARRYRQMSIESDSSVEDTSEGRRKRSSTLTRESGAAWRRRLSDVSEQSMLSSVTSSPVAAKKRCNRSVSLPPGPESHRRDLLPSPRLVGAESHDQLEEDELSDEYSSFASFGASPRLFFTATYKFTLQELEAMFGVYGGLEFVQMIPSFGRLKTMAYIMFATSAAASTALSSFQEDQDRGVAETMNLSYADQAVSNRAAFRRRSASTAGQSTGCEVAGERSRDPRMPERRWVVISYDRSLSNEFISSCVTSCDGMEFVDIKMSRITGEPQGIAFARFERESDAYVAARKLHDMVIPSRSEHRLQAMVIEDPGMFSTNPGRFWSPTPPRREDGDFGGDLGVVQARFAHLMSVNEGHAPSEVSCEELVDPYASLPPPNEYAMCFPPYQVPMEPSMPAPYGYPSPPPFVFEPPHPTAWQQMGSPGPPGWQAASYHMNMTPGGPFAPPPPRAEPPMHHYSNTPVGDPACSVFISSAHPIPLPSVVLALQECSGVLSIAKEDREGSSYMIDFADRRLAQEAVQRLDGMMCCNQRLRVVGANAANLRVPAGRRKRQRLDHRGRKVE